MKAALCSLMLLAATLTSGCIVYDTPGGYYNTPGGYYNAPGTTGDPSPNIHWAESGSYWDGYYRDYIWYFQADVGDPNGAGDVAAVYADVYNYWTGATIDGGFELYPAADGTWFSDWMGSSTWLVYGNPDYVVEISAYDYEGNFSFVDVYPLY